MRAALVVVLVVTKAFAQEQVWTWVDGAGEEHYTNDKGTIPEQFRRKATSTAGQELSVVKVEEGSGAPGPGPRPADPVARPRPAAPSPVVTTPQSARGIRLVLFEASTNSASKTLNRAGVLDKLLADNPGLKIERAEFSTAVERAEKLKVTQLPTVLFLDGADFEVGRTTGLVSLKELQRRLDQARGAAE